MLTMIKCKECNVLFKTMSTWALKWIVLRLGIGS